MKLYNQIAGKNLDRIGALSDGVFAFAMTMLALDLRGPFGELAGVTNADLLHRLVQSGPTFPTFLMAFMTLGIFWVGQQTQLDAYARTDRNLTWIYLAFLATVTVIPFTTWLLVESGTQVALGIYWFNILLLGLILLAALVYAKRHDFFSVERAAFYRPLVNRILYAQSLYAACALLCFVDVGLSVGCILAVQLIYALAPGIRPLYRM